MAPIALQVSVLSKLYLQFKLLLFFLTLSSYLILPATTSTTTSPKSGNESPPVDTVGDIAPSTEKPTSSTSVSNSSKSYGDDEEDTARFSDSDEEPSVSCIHAKVLAMGFTIIQIFALF